MHRPDPHSHYDAAQPKARRLRLKLGVDFATKRLEGEVVLEFGKAIAGPLDLDTKGLEILTAQVPGHGPKSHRRISCIHSHLCTEGLTLVESPLNTL